MPTKKQASSRARRTGRGPRTPLPRLVAQATEFIGREGKVSARLLCSQFRISPTTAQKLLNELEHQGVVQKSAGGKQRVRWELAHQKQQAEGSPAHLPDVTVMVKQLHVRLDRLRRFRDGFAVIADPTFLNEIISDLESHEAGLQQVMSFTRSFMRK